MEYPEAMEHTAELQAATAGLKLLKHLNLKHSILKTDSSFVYGFRDFIVASQLKPLVNFCKELMIMVA